MIGIQRDGFGDIFEGSDRLLTPGQVAEFLGLKTCTIRLWLAQRKIGSIKIGDRAVRIPAREVKKLIERGYVPAAPERAR